MGAVTSRKQINASLQRIELGSKLFRINSTAVILFFYFPKLTLEIESRLCPGAFLP